MAKPPPFEKKLHAVSPQNLKLTNTYHELPKTFFIAILGEFIDECKKIRIVRVLYTRY